jgi:hypothetical protein
MRYLCFFPARSRGVFWFVWFRSAARPVDNLKSHNCNISGSGLVRPSVDNCDCTLYPTGRRAFREPRDSRYASNRLMWSDDYERRAAELRERNQRDRLRRSQHGQSGIAEFTTNTAAVERHYTANRRLKSRALVGGGRSVVWAFSARWSSTPAGVAIRSVASAPFQCAKIAAES